MKKLVVGLLLIFLIEIAGASVRINEIELNPEGNDSGNEWIELYSDAPINLSGWKIVDANGDIINFNGNFTGYFVINSTISLRNAGENLTLKNSSEYIIDEILNLKDEENNNRTWQDCSGEWKFIEKTKGEENNCTTTCTAQCSGKKCGDDGCGGICGTCGAGETCNAGQCIEEESDIIISLEWDEEEIINGEEFEITVILENLEDEYYDIMVWIKNDDGKIISERYGNYSEEEIKWASGDKWAYYFMEGSGDESKKIKIRIKELYNDLKGEAVIFTKIRENGKTAILDEYEDDIDIFEKKNGSEENGNSDDSNPDNSAIIGKIITGEVIRLGENSGFSKTKAESEEKENSIIYKSKSEYIKEYAIYGFGLLCIVLIALLLIDKR